MNVLMISNSTECFGANNSMLDMIVALKKRGVGIIVFLPGKGDFVRKLRQNHIKYYVIPYHLCAAISSTQRERWHKLYDNLLLAWKTRSLVKECNIDLIHTNASNVDFGAILAKMCKLPHIWHIRELLQEHYKLKYDFPCMEKKLMCESDCLIYISRYVAEKRKCGTNHVVLYDGIDLDKYKIHKEELLCGNIIRILYCGKISKEKGVIDVIKAVKKMIEWGYQNVQLDIVGDTSEYYEKLLSYVEKSHLEKYIFFHGYQTDMYVFRKNADIAVMCSRSDALGRVTIESMLGECLVIGADRGGTLELIKDGETGYLYEAGNAGQLAKKMILVSQNIEESAQIVLRAKEYAEKQFNNDDYAEKVYNLYNRYALFPAQETKK